MACMRTMRTCMYRVVRMHVPCILRAYRVYGAHMLHTCCVHVSYDTACVYAYAACMVCSMIPRACMCMLHASCIFRACRVYGAHMLHTCCVHVSYDTAYVYVYAACMVCPMIPRACMCMLHASCIFRACRVYVAHMLHTCCVHVSYDTAYAYAYATCTVCPMIPRACMCMLHA
jgi:hypothetical protein